MCAWSFGVLQIVVLNIIAFSEDKKHSQAAESSK